MEWRSTRAVILSPFGATESVHGEGDREMGGACDGRVRASANRARARGAVCGLMMRGRVVMMMGRWQGTDVRMAGA